MTLKSLTISAITLFLVSLPISVFSQDVQSNTKTENGASNYAGFVFEDDDKYFQPTDRLKVVETIYTGKCPGTELKSQKIAFVSDKTSSAADRRVIITNVTNTDKNLGSLPFTDREYQQDSLSENIAISLGYEHKNGKFIVSEGENQFKYEIVRIEQEGEQEYEVVLDTGKFNAKVDKLTEYEERDGYLTEDKNEDGETIGFRRQC